MEFRAPWSVVEADPRALAGGGILVALGWTFVAIHVAAELSRAATGTTATLVTVIPLGLGVVLFVGTAGIYYYDLGGLALRISGWTLFGTAAFSGVVGIALATVDTAMVAGPTLTVVLVNVAASGAVTGLLIGLYDARQRRLHRRLATEHERAAELDQQLSVLRRVHRHDFRNKLNLIIGNAERLRTGSDGSAKAARTITDAASDLHRITEHLNDLDRIETDHTGNADRIDLVAAIEEAVAAVAESFPEMTVDRDVPNTLAVRASPLLSRAIEELLDNALRHADGDPRVAIEVTVDGDHAELTVRDDGPGIPESEVAIHDAPAETSLDHSNGLGLWFVNWIVEASAGEFDIERMEGGGTTATIRLAVASPP
jgi:signal transduction histidine kinase